jgi:hypothetical protein
MAQRLDPVLFAEGLGFFADPWQRDLLRSEEPRVLVLSARQVGKSISAALLALHQMLYNPGSLALAVCPALRQSVELVRCVRQFNQQIEDAPPPLAEGATHLELQNHSRLVALPGSEATVRGFAAVDLLVLDEAARVADTLYYSLRPMLAVSRGRLLALSTPAGRRGWFYGAWTGQESWRRFRVPGQECPRFSAEFLESERAAMGPRWFGQEYCCSFEADAGSPFDPKAVARAFTTAVEPLFKEADRHVAVLDAELVPLFAEASS